MKIYLNLKMGRNARQYASTCQTSKTRVPPRKLSIVEPDVRCIMCIPSVSMFMLWSPFSTAQKKKGTITWAQYPGKLYGFSNCMAYARSYLTSTRGAVKHFVARRCLARFCKATSGKHFDVHRARILMFE